MTYEGAALALSAAVAKATELGIAQNIAVVDAGANLIAFAQMDGARLFAQHSVISKAQTAASLRDPTGHLPPQFGSDRILPPPPAGDQSTWSVGSQSSSMGK